MKHTAVVLADASRARLFELGRHRGQAGAIEPQLVELRDLVHPGRRQRSAEKLTDSRPGSRGVAGGPGHAVDDHRDAQAEEADRRFAAEVVAALTEMCRDRSVARLLVVAPPRFTGHLRERGVATVCERVDEIALDISDLSGPRALEHLQRAGHLD